MEQTRRSKPLTPAQLTCGRMDQQDHQVVTSFGDYPELQVVFDFFADNPQKVMPSPATREHHAESSGDGDGVLRQDPYWESIRAMQTSELFMEGMLLRSVDCKRKFELLYRPVLELT